MMNLRLYLYKVDVRVILLEDLLGLVTIQI